MKHHLKIWTLGLLSTVFLIGTAVAVEKSLASISDILKNAQHNSKVLVEGKIVRVFDLDTYLLSDGTSEMALSFVKVHQNIKMNDSIVVYGRFTGRTDYLAHYGMIEALHWARAEDPAASTLRNQFGAASPSPNLSAIPAAAPLPMHTEPIASSSPNIEMRLRSLDDLKTKNLITPDEYQEQRHRILNGL